MYEPMVATMKEQASACVVTYPILVLAPWAVIAAATGLHNTLDEVTVPTAWFPVPAIDQELILKVALTSFAIHVV